MTVCLGIDLGRERDNTVLVLARRDQTDEPVRFTAVRVLRRVPFSEAEGGQYDIMRKNSERFDPDLVAVDSTGLGGLAVVDWLRENVSATVWDFDFTLKSKSELLGVAKEYFTAGLIRTNPKFRPILIEFSNIQRTVSPTGNILFKDEPHGDLAWAAALALWAVNEVDGSVGMGDYSKILDHESPLSYQTIQETLAREFKPQPIPKGTMWGTHADGTPYLIKLPSYPCRDCGRIFQEDRHLAHHRETDHGEVA